MSILVKNYNDPMTSYLKLFLITGISVFFGVVAVTVVIDPYRLYQWVEWPGMNRVKPYALNEEPLGKAWLAERVRAKALIVGNSRVEIGLDPEHPAWPRKPVINLGVPGSSLEKDRLYLMHAANVEKPEIVVFGVDFIDFLMTSEGKRTSVPGPARKPETDYVLSVLPDGTPNPDYRWAQWKARVAKAVSLDAFRDSLGTLYYQNSPYARDLTDLGFNPMRDYLKVVAEEGYHVIFKQRDIEAAKVYARKLKRIFPEGRNTSKAFEALRRVIEFCDARRIRLMLVIYPYHGHLLETLGAAGLFPAFEDWKRELVAVAQQASNHDVVLWDFSGYNRFTTEPVPWPDEKGKKVRWYWEAGHFKKELGDLMLARMFAYSYGNGMPPEDFGSILTPGNIEARLAELRQGRSKYILENRRDVARLEQFASGR